MERTVLIDSIESKVIQLREQQLKLLYEIRERKKEIEQIKEIQEQQKQTIKELEDKIKLLKIAKTTETKEGAVDAKLKINELIREIDKCIGLLNM
jgi:inorganic pyrophosphatase